MSAGAAQGSAMKADEWDFTPDDHEVIGAADVYRCARTSDVAERILRDAVDAAANIGAGDGALVGLDNIKRRPLIVAAYMLTSAIVYAAERLAEIKAGRGTAGQ